MRPWEGSRRKRSVRRPETEIYKRTNARLAKKGSEFGKGDEQSPEDLRREGSGVKETKNRDPVGQEPST